MIIFIKSMIRLDSHTSLNSIRYVSREGESPGSQRRSPAKAPLQELTRVKPESEQWSQVHWTVRWKYQLNHRQKLFVLESLILRLVVKGESFGDYLLLSDLFFLARLDSQEYHAFRLRTIAEALLETSDPWEERVEFIKAVYKANHSDYRRVYGNLKKKWKPEEYLSIVQVPLETYIDLTPQGEPYSSYCKGYGEGSSRGLEKTPYSWELDGEPEKDEDQPISSEESEIWRLFTFCWNQIISGKRERFLKKRKQ